MGLFQEIQKNRKELEKFKPVFLGFTGGIGKEESMADFCKRINKESGR